MRALAICLLVAGSVACNVVDKKDTGKEVKKELASEDQVAKAAAAKTTTLEWVDPVVQNLGGMERGQVAQITWRFRNTGNNLLYVTNVRAGCGCTTPDPPKEPIAPGAEGTIKAKFNSSNFSGHVTKEVYVEANNSNRNNDANNKLTFTADIK